MGVELKSSNGPSSSRPTLRTNATAVVVLSLQPFPKSPNYRGTFCTTTWCRNSSSVLVLKIGSVRRSPSGKSTSITHRKYAILEHERHEETYSQQDRRACRVAFSFRAVPLTYSVRTLVCGVIFCFASNQVIGANIFFMINWLAHGLFQSTGKREMPKQPCLGVPRTWIAL